MDSTDEFNLQLSTSTTKLSDREMAQLASVLCEGLMHNRPVYIGLICEGSPSTPQRLRVHLTTSSDSRGTVSPRHLCLQLQERSGSVLGVSGVGDTETRSTSEFGKGE